MSSDVRAVSNSSRLTSSSNASGPFVITRPAWPVDTFLVPALLAHDHSGRIYVVGYNSDNNQQYLARLHPTVGHEDGQADIDSEFGDNGFVLLNAGRGLQVERALQIIDVNEAHLTISCEVLDNYGLYQVALLRFSLDGRVDSGFGVQGVALFPQLPEPSSTAAASSAAGGKTRAAGQLLAVAYKLRYGQKYSYLIRINEDGALDLSFAAGAGYLRLSFAGNANDSDYKVAIDSMKRAVVASGSADGSRTLLARFVAEGRLDPDFGGNGFVEITSPIGAIRQPTLKFDGNDNLVLCVKHIPADQSEQSLYLFRLDDKGNADPSFNDGRAIEWVPDADKTLHGTDHIVVDEQQRIILRSVYQDRHSQTRGILLSRFTGQGIDPDFGEAGSHVLAGSGSVFGGLVWQPGMGGAAVAADRQDIWKIVP